MPATSRFYEQHADCLAEQYTSLKFEDVHASWRAFWPQARDRVLDVGAGSGRDAKWMAEHGCEVIAIEPAQALLRFGKSYCGDSVTGLKMGYLSLRKPLILAFASI